MSDFLTRLALRQLGQIATIEPRVAPLYGAAKETRNAAFVEDSEYRPVTNMAEAEPMPETTASRTTGRSSEHGADPVTSLEPPLVQNHGTSHRPIPRLYAAESRSNDSGPFTVEESSPGGFSTAESPEHFPGRQTEPARAQSLPREVAAPPTRTVPVAPAPLGRPSHAGITSHWNEFTGAAALGREEAPAQIDKENPVHVTIGRIEVTAMTAATPAKRAPARKQTMSLDDYLARRQRRDR